MMIWGNDDFIFLKFFKTGFGFDLLKRKNFAISLSWKKEGLYI